MREACDKAGADPRPRWDWYYLQLVRNDLGKTFDAAKDLVKSLPGDLSAEYAYLMALSGRANVAYLTPAKNAEAGEGERNSHTPWRRPRPRCRLSIATFGPEEARACPDPFDANRQRPS